VIPNVTSKTSIHDARGDFAVSAAPWVAVGSAAHDLPSWVAEACRSASTAQLACAMSPVADCAGAELQERARATFGQALAALDRPPARVWAFLPGVDQPDGPVLGPVSASVLGECETPLDRYMRVNQGRVRAYRESARPMPFVPAGTCVGHAGSNLVVYAMSFAASASPIENPRQRPAWQYSQRFGPASPPFTRAVVVDGRLVASGTASVVGEETVHEGDFLGQWKESLLNLDALRSEARARGAWKSVQIYVREQADLILAHDRARREFGDGFERVLWAPLCRRPLLVELEGVADVGA
jgi:chorismate lyase/3-hydroxybenzoate synthase